MACPRHPVTDLSSFLLLRVLENLAAVFREAPTLECTDRKFLKGHSPPYIAGGTRRLLSRYGSICRGSRDGDDRGDNGDLDDTRTARAQNLHASLVHLDFLPWLMFLLSFPQLPPTERRPNHLMMPTSDPPQVSRRGRPDPPDPEWNAIDPAHRQPRPLLPQPNADPRHRGWEGVPR